MTATCSWDPGLFQLINVLKEGGIQMGGRDQVNLLEKKC